MRFFTVLALLAVGCDNSADDTSTDTDVEGFAFADDDPSAYARVDRMGMPAVNTAVISSKDDYNQADPIDDVNGDFVGEITSNVTALHSALDDDLSGLSLVPCAPADCVSQAAPLVVPDTLKITLGGAAAFPNGRTPEDPVIDITLAVVLLDLNTTGQTAATLAEVPVNPPMNDVTFSTAFPYLASPHQE